jgi:hypothetical protein
MHALRIHARAGPEALIYEPAAVPEPGMGDVLVHVNAASFTPTELSWPATWVDRAGRDRTPVIPGHEVCGTVAALGYGTTGWDVGDAVFGLTDWYRDGTLAEYVAVEARNLAAKPAGFADVEAPRQRRRIATAALRSARGRPEADPAGRPPGRSRRRAADTRDGDTWGGTRTYRPWRPVGGDGVSLGPSERRLSS